MGGHRQANSPHRAYGKLSSHRNPDGAERLELRGSECELRARRHGQHGRGDHAPLGVVQDAVLVKVQLVETVVDGVAVQLWKKTPTHHPNI